MGPLSAVALPPEVVTLEGRGTWDEFRGCSTISPKVPLEPGDRRDSVGDGEGDRCVTVAGLEVDAEMSVAEARIYNGGVFLYLDFIV